MDLDAKAPAPQTSSSSAEPFIGRGQVILWTVLFGVQIVLMLLRFQDWWVGAAGIDKFGFVLVLFLLMLPCVQLWRVHFRLKADELAADPQAKASSFALTQFLTSSLMSVTIWCFVLAMMLTSLFGRAMHAR
jgi:hypothetical protein